MSRLTWIAIGLPTFLGLLISTSFGLGVDEAHYMLYARHLDWSYFDHPPLVGWVHAFFNFFLGESLFSARLPALLLGLFSSWQLFRFLRERGFTEEASRLAVLGAGFCLQFFTLFLFLLPDTLVLALFWSLLRVTVSLAEKPSTRKWLQLGLLLGLMGLAKYTAIFFVIPLAVVLVRRQGFSFLLAPGFFLGVVLAALLISPVIFWNQEHGWASFLYQAGHVASGSEGFAGVFKSWVLQFSIYMPFLWGFAVVGLRELWRRKFFDTASEFSLWTALTYGLFFLWSSYKEVVLPHWPALFYLLTIPVGLAAAQVAGWLKTARVAVALTGLFVSVLVVSVLGGWAFGIPLAMKDVAGWPQVMKEAESRLRSGTERIAVLNWTYGSRALYYGEGFEDRIFVIDKRKDQFDIWKTDLPDGLDLWVIQFSYDEKDLSEIMACDGVSEMDRVPIFERGYEVYTAVFQRCSRARPL